MKQWFSSTWRSESVRAAVTVSAVFAGIVLPLDFLSQVDGYLAYLRPRDLMPVYGWAWVFYGSLGLVIGLVGAAFAAVVCRLGRRPPSALVGPACNWLAASIAMLALIRGGKLWFEALGLDIPASWISRSKWEIVWGTLAIAAIWTWRRPNGAAGLAGLARAGAALGLAVVLVAPLSVERSANAPASDPARADAAKGGTKPPDIVLLTVDTLSANHMSLYGYSRPTTPELEKLAEQSSVFERFYANSNYTIPTINSLINGTRPWTHRANQFLSPTASGRADHGMVARLKQRGYTTIAVTTNPGAAPFANGNERLFDKILYGKTHTSWHAVYSAFGYYLPRAFNSSGLELISRLCDVADRVLVFVGTWTPVDHFDPEIALSAARDTLVNQNRPGPVFLWIHLFPPHAPYATPPPFAGRFDSGLQARTRFDSTPPEGFDATGDGAFPSRYVGRYDEAVAYADHHIGQFLSWLRHQGIFDDVLLVITADHGESFTRGYGQHGGPMLHNDLIHVPLIVKEPGQRAGRRVTTVSEQVDLMPTVLDLAGIQVDKSTEGRSLKPALRGADMRRLVFSMNFQQSNRFGTLNNGSVAAIEANWKYVHYRGRLRGSHMPKLEDSLYDLEADPGENTNLVALQPLEAKRLRDAIAEQLRVNGGPLH